ncbi:type II secretion system F family protein, partial [Candidatus Margulisiibacteriota bacterium]
AVPAVLLRLRRTDRGSLILDQFLLRVRMFSRDQAARALLQGGVPIIEALNTTAASRSNRAFQNIILQVKEAVENGEKLSQALGQHQVFPGETVQMVSVGENSGKLDEILLGISEFYEKEKEVFIKRVTALLEPVLTLFVGLMVAVIAIAMFLPMVNMISGLK